MLFVPELALLNGLMLVDYVMSACKPLLKNPAKTSQGWLAGFGWSPSLVIVGLSGWF